MEALSNKDTLQQDVHTVIFNDACEVLEERPRYKVEEQIDDVIVPDNLPAATPVGSERSLPSI